MERRTFIKSIAGLAALAVAPIGFAGDYARNVIDRARITGVIENETFHLDSPLVLDIEGLIVRKCRFISNEGYEGALVQVVADRLSIERCEFVSGSAALVQVVADRLSIERCEFVSGSAAPDFSFVHKTTYTPIKRAA